MTRWLVTLPADLVMEATLNNPLGKPATVTAAALGKAALVTANRGRSPHTRQALARSAVSFFFDTVMDGAPVHGIGREALLATTIQRVRGVLNSTTNLILTRLEEGVPFDEAVAQAQALGVAEADPSTDLEGWDATVKIVVLANVLMGADLRPADVDRMGITGITVAEAQAAVMAGERIKLLCEAVRERGLCAGQRVSVRLSLSDPLSQVSRTSSAVTFETDTLHELTLIEGDTDPTTTAYGMLMDMINIARATPHGIERMKRNDDMQRVSQLTSPYSPLSPPQLPLISATSVTGLAHRPARRPAVPGGVLSAEPDALARALAFRHKGLGRLVSAAQPGTLCPLAEQRPLPRDRAAGGCIARKAAIDQLVRLRRCALYGRLPV